MITLLKRVKNPFRFGTDQKGKKFSIVDYTFKTTSTRIFTMPNLTASSQCDSVLIPDVVVIQKNLTILAAFLRIIEQSNYDQYKQQYSAIFPEYFSGDYNSFNESKKQFYEKVKLDFQYQEAVSVLQTVVSTDKVAAWLQCMANNSFGLFSFLHDADERGATLTVKWSPPAGLDALRNCSIVLDGGNIVTPNSFVANDNFEGTAELLLMRSTSGERISGVVAGIAGTNGSYQRAFYLPATPKPYTMSIDETLPSSMLFETSFMVPKSIIPVPITLTVKITTSATGEYFTQADRFIQQYVWVDNKLKNDSGEREDNFPEGQVKSLEHVETVTVPAGKQVEIRVRNNSKGARGGPTTLRYTGSYGTSK
jgi:hypothetical protein